MSYSGKDSTEDEDDVLEPVVRDSEDRVLRDDIDDDDSSEKDVKSFRLERFLVYFRKILWVFVFFLGFCFLGFISYMTVYFLQSSRYKRIKDAISKDSGLAEESLLYSYSNPIVVKGRTVPPNGVDFRVSIVLAYSENSSEISELLMSQSPMIQDQIRTKISMRNDWPLKFSEELAFKSELKEWLNILLSGDYILEVFFTDVQ